MDVDTDQLSLAQQVLERQAGYGQAIGEHLESYARLNAGELGLILQLFQPISDGIVDVGKRVADMSSQAFGIGTERMGETVAAYRAAEQSAHDAIAQVAASLGINTPPSSPGTAPTLGAPRSRRRSAERRTSVAPPVRAPARWGQNGAPCSRVSTSVRPASKRFSAARTRLPPHRLCGR
ncbi:hypothetical protein RWH44_10345 [Microbacterium sp. KSW2-29]|uniref:WXG100 family type VII secretion target n=1 Tax=Microbacterium phycohabitans TaxID=3075993 RepID=A0ABU3SN50_9MICO|nr:hypothetical protein [Microbacterium sp. KSW2-29]MDU0346101.1 hypothetical protein [Microbacterium sp. KSW2-29]